MNIIYIVLAILIFFLTLRRRLDFLSIAALSFVLYTSYCVTGAVTIGVYYSSEINDMTYLLIYSQMLIIVAFLLNPAGTIFFKWKWRDSCTMSALENDNRGGNAFWPVLMGACVLVFLHTLFFDIDTSVFFSYMKKEEIQKMLHPSFSFVVWGFILCFFYGLQKKKKVYLYSSVLFMVFLVILGSRAYVAIVFVGFLAYNNRNIMHPLKENIKYYVGGLAFILFFSIYKQVYREIRALDINAVVHNLLSFQSFGKAFNFGEFEVFASVYNYIIVSDFSLPAKDALARIVALFPFLYKHIDTTYPIRISSLVTNDILHMKGWGTAGCFWGEAYVMGGFLFVLMITALWLQIIRIFDRYIDRNNEASPFLLSLLSPLSFYIHRLDWIQVFGCIKSVVVFYLIWYVLNQFHLSWNKQSKLQKYTMRVNDGI